MGYYNDVLEHHGIRGQKWGVRRFQNPDGTLTQKGKKRYLKEVQRDMEAHYKSNISSNASKYIGLNKNGTTRADQRFGEAYRKGKVSGDDYYKAQKAAKEAYKYAESKYGTDTMKALSQSGVLGRPIKDFNPSTTKAGKELIDKINSGEKKGFTDKQKKMIIAGAAVVGTAVAAYGGYKLYQLMDKKATEGLSQKYKTESIKLTDKKYDAIDRMTKWQGNASNYANERNDSSHSSAVRDYAEKARQESLNMAGKAFKDYKDLSAKKGVIDTVAREKAFSKGEKVDFLKEKAAEKINSTVKRDVIKPNTKDWVADRIKDVRSTDNSKMPIYYTEGFSSGRKTPSKPVQNSTPNTIKIAGQQKFNQASKANDDLVQELLKKNTIRF